MASFPRNSAQRSRSRSFFTSPALLIAGMLGAPCWLTACESHDIGQECARCDNDRVDGLESDIDCGGPCAHCADGLLCGADRDCLSGYCQTSVSPSTCAPDPRSASSASRTQTLRFVGQDVTFPCDQLVCVAADGKGPYCSKRCRSDDGCPTGFACEVVQPLADSEFGGEKFCVWKSCAARADCGAGEDFCCVQVPGADPIEEVNLCEFSDDGKCG